MGPFTKGTLGPPPPTPNPLKYHPPSYNTHTTTILQHLYAKGTPHPPTPNPQEVAPTILQHSYTKGTPNPSCLPLSPQGEPPTILHIHTLKRPPTLTPNPQVVPPTILQHSYTHNLTIGIH